MINMAYGFFKIKKGSFGGNPKWRTVYCRTCGAAISGANFPQRMAKLRSHYKRAHPKKWREAVLRGARKRAMKLRKRRR